MRFLTLLLCLPAGALAAGSPGAGPVVVLNHTQPPQYVRWTDPAENAFSLEVPRGWKVSGGLTRVSPIDTRTAVRITSPDGRVRLSLGDADIPPFMIPNYMLIQTGFPEGARYPNGYGGFMIVRRFLPGTQFADEYVRVRAASGCQNIAILDRRDRPELARDINRLMATMPGVQMELSTGEVAFSCTESGEPARGYYFAGSVLAQVPGGQGMWFVQHLHGFLAPAGQSGAALAVLRHAVGTLRQNPAWTAMQSQITRNSARITAQANEAISKTIGDAYSYKWKSLERTFRNDANARRGTTDVTDPSTGETWNIQGGKNHYWRKPGSDAIVGTDSGDPPGFGYVELTEY